MSLFFKSKIKKTDAHLKVKEKESDILSPSIDKEILEEVLAEDIKTNLLKSIEVDHVDIPVDQELDETHGVINLRNISSKGVDFNLEQEPDEKAMFVEAEVLSINPVNSFSHQIDLDLETLSRNGFITPDNANTLLSNTFRMFKRPLIKNIRGKGATVVDNANLIMVTSSLDAEGKSYSAINLALSMAMERDKNVLLIDADVNKPSHHKVFGQQMEAGLTDFLMGKEKDMSKILYKTNIPSFSLMFSGNQYAHATELLASQAMEDFVEDLSCRYPDRIIIFDSPPLLLTTESSALAANMGQVIVVVEAERTLKHQVKHSLSLLSNEIILLLLNKMRETNELGNYGYYGYGHQS